MSFTTAAKNSLNRLLGVANLRLETLTQQRAEDRRLARLAAEGQFDRPVFPLPASFETADAPGILEALAQFRKRFDTFRNPDANDVRFCFANDYFRSPDAEVFYTLVGTRRPARIIEVGSGNSTAIGSCFTGGRCQLFLKERNFFDSSSSDKREIVGLIDDDPSLHLRRVYGYPVLGGLEDLPALVKKHQVSGIIITAILSLESQIAIRRFARKHGVRLSEWRFEEKYLDFDLKPVPQETGEDQVRVAAAPEKIFAQSE